MRTATRFRLDRRSLLNTIKVLQELAVLKRNEKKSHVQLRQIQE